MINESFLKKKVWEYLMHSIKIVHSMLKTCTECHGIGQFKAHELDHTQFSYEMDKEAVSKPVEIDILIMMCDSCYEKGRILDMEKYWEFLQQEKNTYIIEHVRHLLNKFFQTGIKGIDENQYIYEV